MRVRVQEGGGAAEDRGGRAGWSDTRVRRSQRGPDPGAHARAAQGGGQVHQVQRRQEVRHQLRRQRRD